MPVRLALALLVACAPVKPYVGLQNAAPAEPKTVSLRLGPVQVPDVLPLAEALQAVIDEHVPLVFLDIDSPGGSVGVGLAVVDMMKEARAQGTVFKCHIGPSAMAASMAAVIFEAGCDERAMSGRGAQLLFHEVSVSEVGGKAGDLRRVARALADTDQEIATLISWRLGMTAREYHAWIEGHDRWLDASEAMQRHAADSVTP